MHRIAFKMKLHNGFAAEYKKRHDELWPELKVLLKDSGVSDYSIFIDTGTNCLFAVLKTEDPKLLDELPGKAIMQKWWRYMADIMETNDDTSPVSIPLEEIFYFA